MINKILFITEVHIGSFVSDGNWNGVGIGSGNV